MRAAIIQGFGGPERFEIVSNAPKPDLHPNQVLLRVHAAGVNPLDWKIRRGELKYLLGANFPMILGNDVSGVIEEVGAAVTRFRPGDAVFCMLDSSPTPLCTGFAKPGAYAEYAVTREDTLALKPQNLSHEEAASVPLAALTAFQTLRYRAKVKQGDRVLINGASGGVGIFAIQTARLFGARVTAVCGDRNRDMVASLGADDVISYQEMKLTDIEGPFDVIYDVVANSSFYQCRHMLTEKGIFISNIASPSRLLSTWLNPVCHTLGFKKSSGFAWVRPSGRDLGIISRMFEHGELRTVVDRVFPLEAVHEAHIYSEKGQARGKIVLRVTQ
ncbi:MAG: NADPH:quinone reductase [Herpetosiphonaceae bacterium]|nr:MAG: NADPH:quinone reductase [Herpetosiphonaceae bacterium]